MSGWDERMCFKPRDIDDSPAVKKRINTELYIDSTAAPLYW